VRSSADIAAREAVVRAIIALERACLDAESAFVERRWADVRSAFGRQSALTFDLGRLFAEAPETAPASDAKVARRIRGILAYRDDQLRRMRAYRDEVGERLNSVGKVNALARSLGRGDMRPRLLDGQF